MGGCFSQKPKAVYMVWWKVEGSQKNLTFGSGFNLRYRSRDESIAE